MDQLGKLNLSSDDLELINYVRTPVAIIESGMLRYVNPAFCSLFDTPFEKIENLPLLEVISDRAMTVITSWEQSEEYENGENLKLDMKVSIEQDQPKWLNGNLVRAHWNGKAAIVGFLVDIEEKKKNKEVEEQLRQSQKMEALGRLAGGIAHDMNNLLGGVMGFASVIQSEMDPGSRFNDDLDHILGACRKGRDLMLNLMGFAQRGKYRLERINLNDTVKEVIEILKHTIPKKIRIVENSVCNEAMVSGDPSQIHHALMNLFLNAVDAMGETGTLSIDTDTTYISGEDFEKSGLEELEEGEYARLVIRDTGVGMTREVMDQALEPFFTTKPQGKGSGLGLSMVYGTIANHGGAVVLESQLDLGTAVSVLLPVSHQEFNVSHTLNERRSTSELALATILLVDDEDIIRLATERLLKSFGYRVLLAADGREAIRVFVEHRDDIALVIMDLIMPVMDGEETLFKMKEIDPEIPVLLCSGYSKEEKADQLFAKGANGFIQKPFEIHVLKERIAELME